MDKYGVQVDPEKVKEGSVKVFKHECCPDCEAVLDLSGSVPICPHCGSKPFEKQPAKEK
jgi:predicted amidophosphoribosyltransferase